MGKGSRGFINLSKSGAKIRDLHRFANDFCSENPSLVGDVDKIENRIENQILHSNTYNDSLII
jgi:hypothetical protein